MTYLYLCYEFFKTGLFAIGGGLATLPFLYNIADKYSWLNAKILPDMIAVSESTPGPIGVNMATYAGFNAGYEMGGFSGGIFGALIATLSLITPSLIIIIIVSKFLEKFQDSTLVKDSFFALKSAVCGLIMGAFYTVFSNACLNIDLYKITKSINDLINYKAIVVFLLFFIINKRFKLHPILLIIPGAIVGIIFKM